MSVTDDNKLIANSNYLVVDDFPGMRGTLSMVLRNCGVNPKNIDTASNGSEAIKTLSRKKYDVVLCDFNLGDGKTGAHVLEEAKYRSLIGPSCCWIMVTAEKTTDTVMGSAESQPDAYLIKPVTEAILISRLQKIRAKKESFIEIDRAIAGRDYLQAIQLCDERAINDKANAIELLRVKCDLLTRTGQSDKARATYENVLASRDVPWAQLGLARIHMLDEDFESAAGLLEQLVDNNRSYLEAYDYLAEAHQALGQNDKAEATLERALALSPNSHVRQRAMGDLSLKTGKLDRAEKAFRKTVTLAEHSVRKSPEAYLGLAKTVSAKSNPQEALNVLEQMNKKFSGEEVRLKGKSVEGLIYHQSGNAEKAKEVAQELSSMLESSSTRIDSAAKREMAELLLATGEHEKGLALLQAEVMNNPEDKANLAAVREIFRKTGFEDQGAVLVEASRKEAMDMMNAGTLLAKEGDFAQAIDKLRSALEKMPANVRLLLNSAHIMITYMEKSGANADLINEVRRNLLTANQLAPAEQRFLLLMNRLKVLE
ncbi:MAG: tetratricopeptide repeat protein [Uliginosibacterium sp.]|nr:tetratricopeptide repeat protein [Uliginosibacterium sp.]